jgi:hypothetical protein
MAFGRKTGGRQKGSKNKRTLAAAAATPDAVPTGPTPLQFMLEIMRNPKLEHTIRMDAAKAAAPYLHSKLVAVDNLHRNEPPINTAKSASQLRHELILELVKYGYLKPIEPPQQIEGVAEPAGTANPVKKGNRSA